MTCPKESRDQEERFRDRYASALQGEVSVKSMSAVWAELEEVDK